MKEHWGVSFNGKCTWNIEEIKGNRRHIARVERQKDARLIAAAPALLDALCYCIPTLEQIVKDDPMNVAAKHNLTEARTVIAKAEGGNNGRSNREIA